jgi:glycosyltransferase involved in cell wall biosynthesis
MKILWINPSFLDYRVPVYEELNKLVDGELQIVYSDTEAMTPKRVSNQLKAVLKEKAIGLGGVKTFIIGNKGSNQSNSFANKFIKLNYQPDLFKVVRGCDVDVIIVEGFFQWSPAGFLKKIFQGVPIVLSYERTFHTERNAPKWRELYRKMVIKFFIDTAVVNGKLSKEYTSSLGLKKEKITTGGMAADSIFFKIKSFSLEREECRNEWRFSNATLVFLYVGRLIELKGIVELLKSWKDFNEDVLLVCAGSGDQKEEIFDYLKIHNIDNVRLLGAIAYEKLPSLYKASDVFIIPTLEDNWSLVVPEAMACGLPVACSKYNGCWPELVHDDVNGKVFDPLDSDDTLKTLKYFYKKRDMLVEMGKASERIGLDYTPKNAAEAIFDACKMALKR